MNLVSAADSHRDLAVLEAEARADIDTPMLIAERYSP